MTARVGSLVSNDDNELHRYMSSSYRCPYLSSISGACSTSECSTRIIVAIIAGYATSGDIVGTSEFTCPVIAVKIQLGCGDEEENVVI